MSLKSKIRACKDIIQMQFVKRKQPFQVLSIDETINLILECRLSVSRYGEDELLMMANQMHISFQTYDKTMATRLKQVIDEPCANHLVCIPDLFEDLSKYNESARNWFNRFLGRKKYLWYRYFDLKKQYGSAYITRPYMDLIDKSQSPHYYQLLKQIWTDREIVII